MNITNRNTDQRTVNTDLKTGIHYGVISQNQVLQAWADSSEPFYHINCPYCGATLKKKFEAKRCPSCYKPLSENDFDCLEPSSFFIDDKEYLAECGEDGDIFILRSPFYTRCRLCSPCAPNAGYLLSPDPLGVEAYCFGDDWFEEVETGEEIDCQYCEGKGKRIYPEHSPLYNGELVDCHVCNGTGKVKKMVHKAPYPIFSAKKRKK